MENKELLEQVVNSYTGHGGGWCLDADEVEPFAWAEGLFTDEQISNIINIGNSLPSKRGRIVSDTSENPNTKIRSSSVSFIYPNSETSWIFNLITEAIKVMNEKYFKFKLYGIIEGLQFTKYESPGEHYAWHADRGWQSGQPRKLSVVIQLSDPDDYEGGSLELLLGDSPLSMERKKGLVVSFPSWTLHRVTPMVSGTRYSLVCWVAGPSFV